MSQDKIVKFQFKLNRQNDYRLLYAALTQTHIQTLPGLHPFFDFTKIHRDTAKRVRTPQTLPRK